MTYRKIPGPRGLPWVGNVVPVARDPYGSLIGWYREFGPAFRLKMMGQEMVTIIGRDANLLMKERDGTLFVAAPAMEKLARALGTKRFLMTVDGAEHKRLRRVLSASMTRRQIDGYIPVFCRLAGEHFERWSGTRVDAVASYRRLVYAQLAGTLSTRDAADYYDDVLGFFGTAVRVAMARIWPEAMVRRPRNRRAKARLLELCEALYEDAERGLGRGGFTDRVRVAVEEGLLNRDDLLASLMGPYFAGIDTTASTLASATYHMASQPEWTARMRLEVEAAGGIDNMSSSLLRALPVVRAFVKETLRRYPIGILGARYATEDFEFAGVRIAAGTLVSLSPPMVHFMEEHWPDPWTFDPERFLSGGGAKAPPELYAPYSIGSRVCLGAGLADIQMLATVATLASRFDITLDPPDYRIRIVPDPLPVARGLRLRLRPVEGAQLATVRAG